MIRSTSHWWKFKYVFKIYILISAKCPQLRSFQCYNF
jgi:hypothetical protein